MTNKLGNKSDGISPPSGQDLQASTLPENGNLGIIPPPAPVDLHRIDRTDTIARAGPLVLLSGSNPTQASQPEPVSLSAPLQEFTLFSRLPTEMRLLIWKIANARFITIGEGSRNRSSSGTINNYTIQSHIPATLHVNQESRSETLKNSVQVSLSGRRIMLFNFNQDTLLVQSFEALKSFHEPDTPELPPPSGNYSRYYREAIERSRGIRFLCLAGPSYELNPLQLAIFSDLEIAFLQQPNPEAIRRTPASRFRGELTMLKGMTAAEMESDFRERLEDVSRYFWRIVLRRTGEVRVPRVVFLNENEWEAMFGVVDTAILARDQSARRPPARESIARRRRRQIDSLTDQPESAGSPFAPPVPRVYGG